MRASALLALLPLAAAAPSIKRDAPAPVLTPRGATVIEGKYIVKLRDDVDGSVDTIMSAISSTADHVYNNSKFTGFAASLTKEELKKLRENPRVRMEI